MDGGVGVDSQLGRGSTFWCELPLPMAAEGDGAGESDDGDLMVGSLRILVADDVEVNRMVAQGILSKMGHDLEMADDGNEAVAAVIAAEEADNQFDVVLMDCQMPNLDGYDATRQIRERGLDVPIVALTASAMGKDRERCFAAGMNDFVTKPINRDDLARALAKWGSGAGAPVVQQ